MATAKAAVEIKTLIGPHEVVTSTELRERLAQQGLNDAHARKIIQREFSRSNDFWRSDSIVLPGGQRLFARRTFFGRRDFYNRIGDVLKEKRPGLARCLTLLGTDRVLNRVQASKLLASPVQGSSKVPFPDYDDDIQALKELGVSVCRAGTALEYLLAAGTRQTERTDELAAKAVAGLRKESLLARILTERFRRQNMVSWGGVELPNRERLVVTFNNQSFTAYGFCHLAPVRRQDEENGKSRLVPAPVLFDVHVGRCSELHIHSFIARAERATCRGRRRQSWLGVIAAREFEQSAWKLARRSGLMTVNFRQMFGDEALEAMVMVEELLEAFQHDRLPEESDPKFISFAESLAELKTNPVVIDLRSLGFEILAGKALSANGYEGVNLGLDVPFEERTRDVDVFGRRGDEVYLIECKAYHEKKLVTSEDVNKFYKETLPSFMKWWSKRESSPSKFRAEIWTTGRIGSEAKRQLERLSLRSSVAARLLDSNAIQAELPASIRKQCLKMMRSIAMSDETGADTVEDPDSPEEPLFRKQESPTDGGEADPR